MAHPTPHPDKIRSPTTHSALTSPLLVVSSQRPLLGPRAFEPIGTLLCLLPDCEEVSVYVTHVLWNWLTVQVIIAPPSGWSPDLNHPPPENFFQKNNNHKQKKKSLPTHFCAANYVVAPWYFPRRMKITQHALSINQYADAIYVLLSCRGRISIPRSLPRLSFGHCKTFF